MTDQKISQLPDATLPLALTEPVPLVQDGETRQAPASAFVAGAGPMTTFISQPTGTVSVTTTAEIELATIAVAAGAANRKLLILANASFTKDSGTTARAATMRLRQGTNNSGTLLKEASAASTGIASSPFGTATIAFLHEPGAGETNYRISAVNFASATVTANNISIQVVDLTGAKGDDGEPGPAGGGLLAAIVDEKASGTGGGNHSGLGNYDIRTLNTVAFDPGSIVTLSITRLRLTLTAALRGLRPEPQVTKPAWCAFLTAQLWLKGQANKSSLLVIQRGLWGRPESSLAWPIELSTGWVMPELIH